MAVLESSEVRGEPDPKMSFHLDILGSLKYPTGKTDPDWYQTKLGIKVFGTRLDRPDPHVCRSDIESLVKWFEQLVEARNPVKPFHTMEPMFRINAEPIAGPTFLVKIVLQAWGTVPMFFSEQEGVAVILPASADSIARFSKQLQEEMEHVAHAQS